MWGDGGDGQRIETGLSLAYPPPIDDEKNGKGVT